MIFAHLGSGPFEPLIVGGLAAAMAAYLVRVRSLRQNGVSTPRSRQGCFYCGITVLVTALVSPVAHVGGELLWMHMVQHLLIIDIGALLLVLGTDAHVLSPLLKSRVFHFLRKLAHPVVVLPLWAINLYLWHLPVLYQATLHSGFVHALEHSLFIGLGIAIWLPLFGPLPTPAWFGNGARLLYISSVRVFGALLANILIWSGTVFYPDYARGEKLWGMGALADQGLAGQIMMIEGSVVTLVLFGWLFFKAARESEEKQQLLEFAHAQGAALDETRAARAAAAGSGTQLRERIAAGVNVE